MNQATPGPPPFARTFEVVLDGFVTPHRVYGVPGELSGCVHRADGSKVVLSERFGGYLGDLMPSGNPSWIKPPKDTERLKGRGLYLGNFMSRHYGHFITETLSTFWIFEEFDACDFDYVLFHPFIFGTSVPEFARFCLDRFGITPAQIRFAESRPLAFEELLVPERLFRLNHSADPRLRWVYGTIAATAQRPRSPSRAVYVSRRRIMASRLVANEVRIEALFVRAGFEIVYPEALPFVDQIALYGDTEILAGLSGSNLHNSLFTPETAHVIELGDPRYDGAPSPTQELCNAVSRVSASFIPFQGRIFGARQTMLFDMAHLARGLSAILCAPALGRAGAPTAPPRPGLQDMAEIGYRCVKPDATHMARRLLGRRMA